MKISIFTPTVYYWDRWALAINTVRSVWLRVFCSSHSLILLKEVRDVNTVSSHRNVIRNMFFEALCVWPNTVKYIYCKLIGAADARLSVKFLCHGSASVLQQHSWYDYEHPAGDDGLSHNNTVLYPNMLHSMRAREFKECKMRSFNKSLF